MGEMTGRQSSSVALLDSSPHRGRALLDPHREQARLYAKPLVDGRARVRPLPRGGGGDRDARCARAAGELAADRLPRARRDLHRGRPARGGGRRHRGASRCEPRPSTRRSSPSSAARPTGPWSRSRTRSRARSAPTLDTLAFDADRGDDRRRVRLLGQPSLIGRAGLAAADDRLRSSPTPKPLAQCARFIREQLPGARARAVEQHRRGGAPGGRVGASRGRRSVPARPPSSTAAASCATDVADEADNVTRFVWIAPVGTAAEGDGSWKTTLVFSELGEDHPGALVEALLEFSRREVNLTRIESRPLRQGGSAATCSSSTSRAPRTTRRSPRRSRGCARKAESVRVLGLLSGRLKRSAAGVTSRIAAIMAQQRASVAGARAARPARRPPTRRPRHGSRHRRPGAGPQRDLRADQRLHRAAGGRPGPQGEGRGARARPAARCAPSGCRWSARP